MPLFRCTKNGQSGWKYGENGVCFIGPDAKDKALKVSAALHAKKVDRCDNETVKDVARFDQGEITGNTRITPEGFIETRAIVTRTGVFNYKNPDGTIRKELRHPDDVLKSDSLDSMKMIPIVNDHPPEKLVTAESAKRLSIGFTGEKIKPDGKFIYSSIKITDSEGVSAVQAGKTNLSLGYQVDLIREDGEYDGQQYEFRQTNIRYNHLALVDRARAGGEARILMDSEDAICIDAVLTTAKRNALPDSAFCYIKGKGEDKVRKFPSHDAEHVRAGLSRLSQSNIAAEEKVSVLACLKRKAKQFGVGVSNDTCNSGHDDYNLDSADLITLSMEERNMGTLRIDNIDYEDIPQQVVNDHAKLTESAANLTSKNDSLTKEKDTLQANLDSANDELKTLKARDIKKDVADAVKSRVQLERQASTVLDKETVDKLESMSDAEIKKAVILKKFPDAKEKLDSTDITEDYISARFDSAIDLLGSGGPSSIASQRQTVVNNDAVDKSTRIDADESRKKMIERLHNGGKEK